LIASPEICGEGVVRKIVFKLVDISTCALKSPPPPIQPGIDKVLSQSEQLKIESASRGIRDPRLRKSFSRLMGKLMTR